MSDELSPEKILQTGFAFWPAKTLLSAVELGVFTELATKPANLDELRDRHELHPRGARDFFDTLVALGFLKRDGDGVYSNTPETDSFLDKSKPSYVGGILEMANHRLYPFWADLTTALKTGEQQNESKAGQDMFGNLYSDPERLSEFLRAMSGVSRGANLQIARQFPWSDYKTFVDAGTAQGDLAVQIALANPHLNGIGFDLPPVQPIFEKYAEENGLANRLRFEAGSFFDDPLPKADVVLYGHILHDWDLEEKRHLLKVAYDAVPEGGAVVVYDSIIDNERSKNAFGLMMSLNMLIETEGGFDYTGADCEGWLRDAGFSETRVEHLVGPDSMVIGIK
ncbi:MAG: methyltransferase [Verrucomicrobiales bacterium]|nr:methyltransferase [Verrucomicrobiales bacterium]